MSDPSPPTGPLDDASAAARWRRVKSIFQAALDLPPDARAAHLDTACGDDPSLRREVEQMLDADARGDAFLAGPPAAGLADGDDDDASELAGPAPGTVIGAYRLVERIGSGGMGTVWFAERADGAFEQRVAIKLIKRGMDSEEILRRFRTERQVLARLEHPNIARLLDGGATADGAPYLVMEHVDGVPIDEYCDARRLSLGDRLRLFRTVCDAVQHAHRTLVVHRDLKPGNVLVSDGEQGPTVKLLDFGIAKVLGGDGDGAADVTAPGLRLMTPRYASPEQVRGEPVATTTDVYSLGVILYEVLTGRRPYPLTGRSRDEYEDAVCRTMPPRPSTAIAASVEPARDDSSTADRIADRRRTDAGRLARRLRGDLDVILLTAPRKEPERRYATVDQLSDDLGRYLDGRPVLARPDTVRYRVGKFGRRNPALAFGGVAILAISVAAAVVSSVYAYRAVQAERRAADEADAARRQTAVAESINDFLQRILAQADPVKNPEARDVTLHEAVEQAGAIVDESFSGQPDVEGAVRYTLGVIDMNLGRMDRSREQLERSWSLLRTAHGETDRATMLARAQHGLALIRLGRLDDAAAVLGPALELVPSLPADEWEVATQLDNQMGLVHLQRGDGAAAEPLLRRAIATATRGAGPEHYEVLTSRHNLGGALMMQGRLDDAIEIEEDVLALRRRVRGAVHPDVAESLNTLAFYSMRAERYEDALPIREEALALRRTLYAGDHPLVAKELHNMAFLLNRMERAAEALPLELEAIAMWERTLGPRHPDVIRAYTVLATIHDALGQADEAAAARRVHDERRGQAGTPADG
ncbi:MAG: serine/threonine-protein kinase [Planctomycetota bacterium]|jgi:serine/threonine-protein kinase